ncbi:MAG: hypothetical protein IPK33_22310 [Gemmatimonadetes bacterium]|nr:hypothetical protein [Gemmatimonadota bacterium]
MHETAKRTCLLVAALLATASVATAQTTRPKAEVPSAVATLTADVRALKVRIEQLTKEVAAQRQQLAELQGVVAKSSSSAATPSRSPAPAGVLAEERAKVVIDAWMQQEGLEIFQWQGLLQDSNSQATARVRIKSVEYAYNNPLIFFVFQKAADGRWALTNVRPQQEGVLNGFYSAHRNALGDVFVVVP